MLHFRFLQKFKYLFWFLCVDLDCETCSYSKYTSSSLRFHGVCIFVIFFVVPSPAQSRLQGRLSALLQQQHHHHHHLGGGFLATTVVHNPPFLFLSTPLLPGSIYWPWVWPWNPWDPPESTFKVCPIFSHIPSFNVLIVSLFAYSGVHLCFFLLLHVPSAYSHLISPLWAPLAACIILFPWQLTKVNCHSNKLVNCLILSSTKVVFIKSSCF